MTVLLTLDTEQAALVRLGVESSLALLRCRLGRTDPDGVISDACKLQTVKLDQVRRQIASQGLVIHDDATDEQVSKVRDAIEVAAQQLDKVEFLHAFDRAMMAYLDIRLEQQMRKPVPEDYEGVGEPWL